MCVVYNNVYCVTYLKVSPDEVVEKILSLINDGFLQHVIGPALFQVCNVQTVFSEYYSFYYCRSLNKLSSSLLLI